LDAFDLQAKLQRYIRLTDEEAQIFRKLLTPTKIKNREYLLVSGDVCRTFSLVTEGCLVNYYEDDNGFEHVLQFATPMWWTADLHSLMHGGPTAYSIKALTATKVLQITREGLEQLYREVPSFERYFRIIFQNALIAHQRRIIQNIAFPAEQRYLEFRDRYPEVEQLVPQKYIASYLGITPEFLSKIRKRLAQKGKS
jgi:CRP-like cAMP-binding protein